MLRRLFWPEAFDLLEGYAEKPARKMRVYAALSLLSVVLLSSVPYIAGTFINGLVKVSSDQNDIDLAFVMDTGAVVVLIITFWYVTTSSIQKEMVLQSLALTRKIREDLGDKFMTVSIGDVEAIRSGEMSAKLSGDLPAVGNLLSKDFVSGNVMIVMILVAMVFVSPALALVYIVTIPSTLIAARILTRMSERDFLTRKETMDAISSGMGDIIANHRTIKINNLEDVMMDRFEESNRQFVRATVQSESRSGLMVPLASVASNFGYVATVLAGAVMMFDMTLDLGMFLAFMVYVRLVNKPLAQSASAYDNIKSETMSLKRMLSILNMPDEEEKDLEDGPDLRGSVEFEDVRFSYSPGKEALRGVSFTVEEGEVAVIAGPTGSGKTTLLNLLMRFYVPDSGTVRIGGRDVSGISRRDLSRTVAAVLQDPWVFDGTIRENIVYNRKWVTQEDLDAALAITGFEGYVNSLPDGLETRVGDDVRILPLAQRRMLAMARAVLGDPKILVLDEAFSGLDPLTESAVFEGLRRIMAGRTVLIVSHERVMADCADKVIRLESGRTVRLTRGSTCRRCC